MIRPLQEEYVDDAGALPRGPVARLEVVLRAFAEAVGERTWSEGAATGLCSGVEALVPLSGAAVLVRDPAGSLRVAAASGRVLAARVHTQVGDGAGAVLEAARGGARVRIADEPDRGGRPRAGVEPPAVHVVPLTSGGVHLMYRAKERGGGTVAVVDTVERRWARERAGLVRYLDAAVASDELRLHYQPIVRLRDERVSCVEALVRWQHPTRGLLTAGVFIPATEESTLVGALGRWTLAEACRVVAAQRVERPDLRIAVNLSPWQLSDRRLVGDVRSVLAEAGVDGTALMVEITERSLLHDVDATRDVLRALTDLGVGVAIDDFGVGYSSLAYLTRFPVDIRGRGGRRAPAPGGPAPDGGVRRRPGLPPRPTVTRAGAAAQPALTVRAVPERAPRLRPMTSWERMSGLSHV